MFWAALLGALLLCAAIAVLLYALAVWVSVRDESYLETVRDLIKQIASGEFF